MAIYWVDPHIGAAVQANGTTSTTIRDGSYASPWALADVSSTSQTTLPTKMTPLVAGDEIRFKGLPINTYTLELPNTTFRIASAFGGGVTDFRTNGVADSALITTDYVGTGATIWPRFLYTGSIPALGGSAGFIPVVSISNSTTYFTLSGGSTWNPGYGYTMMGNNVFTARVVKYKEYGIDINTLIGATSYILARLPDGVKVTAGWTSETVRDGVTLLLLWSAASSTVYWCYPSAANSATAGWFECPELYMLHGGKGSNNTSCTFGIGSGKSGTTSTIGGYALSYAPGNQSGVRVNGGATVDVAYAYHCAYGLTSSTVNVSASSYGNKILRNIVGSYQAASSVGSAYVNYTIGNVHGGSDTTAGIALLSVAVGTPTYTFLDNAILSIYSGASPTAMNAAPTLLTAPSTVTNTFSGRITNVGAYPGTAERPLGMRRSSAVGLPSQGLNAAFNLSTLVSTTLTNLNEGQYYVGELDTGGVDYRTATNSNILDASSTAGVSTQNRSYVYQSNSYDGRPLMMMISADHFPCLLYNDSTKDEALAFHQFVESATKYFQKDIPVAIPAYTTENVNFQAVYSTSTTFNGSMVMELWTVNSQTGVATMQSTLTVNAGNLADSQMNVTLTNSTLTSNNIKTAYLRMKFTAGSNGGQKFWLQSVTATLPTP